MKKAEDLTIEEIEKISEKITKDTEEMLSKLTPDERQKWFEGMERLAKRMTEEVS